ncbi:MAG: type 2 isopentenyl-diphosphate Delta-isomerase [Myxococcales bacterium]|nr:type 2 isopentenyl-diphosphate Delta-isomerase [Myxococcales bacterium]
MTETLEQAQRRKNEHLQIAMKDPSVQRPGRNSGLAAFDFEMLSLPELSLDAIDTRCQLLGKSLAAPLMIGAMTGGTSEAGQINRILAQAAEHCEVGFCLGSQRPMLIGDPAAAVGFQLRDVAPNTLICGNIGAIQLRDRLDGPRLAHLGREIGADAMIVHINALQEAIQPEGDRDWRGVFEAIAESASDCELPVLVKEVGAGLGDQTLKALALTGIAGVETAGVGGTSWAQIEALRHRGRTPRSIAGAVLAGFGTPTSESVQLARRAFPGRIVVASGGLRDGLEVAKCIALGADAAAMAYPFLKAAQASDNREDAIRAVVTEIEGVIETLRITMFLVGAPTLSHLGNTPLVTRA